MGDVRIRIAKDKESLVKALRKGDDTTGPFKTYVDVLIFAASLGMQKEKREPITEYSKEIGPIRQDIFYNGGYEQVINLLAVADKSEPRIVANNSDAEEERIKIFEEYANSGLDILSHFLKGVVDYGEGILGLLTQEKERQERGGSDDEPMINFDDLNLT